MSSPRESEAAGGHASPPTERDTEGANDDSRVDETPFTEVRQLIRLIQCRVCSAVLRDPYALPCGGNVCKSCMPGSHHRAHISFFATSDRLQGLWCPLPDCAKEHAVGDCSPDVALGRTLGVIEAELENALNEAQGLDLITHIMVKDYWETTGISSLREPESASRVFKGGRLLATYALAKAGNIKYEDEVTYVGSLADGQAATDSCVLGRVKRAARAEVDCQICYALFYDPVTTPCGHTFCRPCLQRVLDHAKYCPVCRRSLTIQPMVYSQDCPSNQILTKLISTFWSELLAERRQIAITEGLRDGRREYDIPVFVCTLSFPSMPTFLHVFEPRYRLMIRRALEGDRTFGMVLGGSFMELGTLLRIVNVQFFPDGRSLLETVGTSRFRILERGILDGYVVARIQKVNDVSVAEEEALEAAETSGVETGNGDEGSCPSDCAGGCGSPARSRSPATREEVEMASTRDLMSLGEDFVRRMQAQSAPWLAARILAIYGECPNDPILFPWWLANVLPVRDSEKYRLLGTTTVRERLKMCCHWILEWERDTW